MLNQKNVNKLKNWGWESITHPTANEIEHWYGGMMEDSPDSVKRLKIPLQIMEFYLNFLGLGFAVKNRIFNPSAIKLCYFDLEAAYHSYSLHSALEMICNNSTLEVNTFPIGAIYYMNANRFRCNLSSVENHRRDSFFGMHSMHKEVLLMSSDGCIYSTMDNHVAKHADSLDDFITRFFGNKEMYLKYSDCLSEFKPIA